MRLYHSRSRLVVLAAIIVPPPNHRDAEADPAHQQCICHRLVIPNDAKGHVEPANDQNGAG